MNAVAPIQFLSAYRQLRPAEKLFVDNYVSSLETAADRRNERISLALDRPADVTGPARAMLERQLVQLAIRERVLEIAAASELSPRRVLKEMMTLAFSSMNDYMQIGEDGYPYFDLAKCTPEQLAAIQHVKTEVTPQGKLKFEIKLYDKQTPLFGLMDYMGMREPDNPHWRSDSAKPVNAPTLPGNTNADAAADVYAKFING